MSWIFGILNRNKPADLDFRGSSLDISAVLNDKFHSLSAGGNKDTLYYSAAEGNLNWIVSGVGIKEDAGSFKIMKQNDWSTFFASGGTPEQLNGHYAAICKTGNELKLFTDILGLRDIYLYGDKERIIFTTRICLLSKFVTPKIDFAQFGSRWILLNQLSTKSIFKNVIRITAGRSASINLDSLAITITENNWLPDFTKRGSAGTELECTLASLITFPFKERQNISLSLSGGMDSRVILAYLLNADKSNWNTHTFGNPLHPDSYVTKELARVFNFAYELVTPRMLTDNLINDLSVFNSAAVINAPASANMQLNNYNFTANLNSIILDGGFGEILRREFLNKLLWKCKADLFNGNAEGIFPYLKLFRADVFSEEINDQMNEGSLEQIHNLIKAMPPVKEIELEDWLDLFSIRTRLPNYYGPEQTRIDGIHTNYMPFVQPAFLERIFALPVEHRRNGKLSKELIRKMNPALAEYPLVKGNTTHPFFMSSFQSRVWSFLQRKLKADLYADTQASEMLVYLKEFIFDTVNSKGVKENPAYDYYKVKTIVDNYYSGKQEYASQLDWWLSFHLFYMGNNLSV